jgi:Icc-related predicted phosphoesterase
MNLLHVSDTHGRDLTTIPLEGIDVVVHSGDIGPTVGRDVDRGERIRPVKEIRAQRRWWRRQAPRLAAWLGTRPFLYVLGNHDFYQPEEVLCEAGIGVHNLSRVHCQVGPVSFYGYRFIPYVEGEWAGELRERQIAADALDFPDCDVLVTHAPPHGILDVDGGRHHGSTALRDEYLDHRPRRPWPKVWLCGHVHPFGGRRMPLDNGRGRRTLVVNSAETYQVIQLGDRT